MTIHWLGRGRTASHCWGAAAAAMLAFVAIASGQTPEANAIAAQLRAVTPHLVAYGQVESINTVQINAAETGVVEGLRAVPGTRLRAGQEIAQLGGPSLRTVLLQNEADVRSARAQLAAAQRLLTIQRRQLPAHLTTRQAVQQAESTEAQAQTGLDKALSRLDAARQMMTLTAPAAGIVVALNSGDGQLVSAGQPLVTLQPEGRLWLRANYYGSALHSIHVGIAARFTPSDGSAPVAVRVCSVPGTLAAGGGESIALCSARPNANWLNGEAGTVTVDLPRRMLVAVPTRALVLNDGKWWVMIHTAKGNHPQQVEPGPTEGWNTFIESGLAAGAQVIVNNAYLLFHASIAEQFEIPD
jgi:RND family efflux transporter MFP subunit